MIIDGNNLILGRLASVAAKKALLGDNIIIVNCDKVIVTGTKKNIVEIYKEKTDRGNPFKGPFFPKMPDRIVRRTIRSMLPYKKPRGREAYKRIMCYLGVPKKYEKENLETIKQASAQELKRYRYINLTTVKSNLK